MKALIRWGATLSLIGSAAFGTVFGFDLPAQALPEEQVAERLQYIPAFAVVGQDGAPLVANADGRNISGVFISQQDANAFVTKLKRENPQLGNQVRVQPTSLAEIYKLDAAQGRQQNGLDFAYVPVQSQVEAATNLLRQQGQNVQQFNGVPLFVARGGRDNGYLTLQQEGQQVIPFFFEQAQLQQLITRFQQQQPGQASNIKIEVVPLEGVIATLEEKNDPQLTRIMLIPTQESLRFLESVRQQRGR